MVCDNLAMIRVIANSIITTEKGVWKKLVDVPKVHRGWYNPMGYA